MARTSRLATSELKRNWMLSLRSLISVRAATALAITVGFGSMSKSRNRVIMSVRSIKRRSCMNTLATAMAAVLRT